VAIKGDLEMNGEATELPDWLAYLKFAGGLPDAWEVEDLL
jgi:hypothetical protein